MLIKNIYYKILEYLKELKMAIFSKKLKIQKNSGATEDINLYTTKAEAGNESMQVQVDGTNYYAAIGKSNDPNSSSLKVSDDKNVLKQREKLEPTNSKMYTSNGTFTVPEDAAKLWVTASAAGGGGGGACQMWMESTGDGGFKPYCYSGKSGGSGGNTSLGNLFVLRGGGGASGEYDAVGNGYDSSITRRDGTSFSSSSVMNGYGEGGAGYGGRGGNGGRGENCKKKVFTVTPGTVLNVIVGLGGAGGAGGDKNPGQRGASGQQGFVFIEW